MEGGGRKASRLEVVARNGGRQLRSPIVEITVEVEDVGIRSCRELMLAQRGGRSSKGLAKSNEEVSKGLD